MHIFLICLGVYLVGGIITFIISPFITQDEGEKDHDIGLDIFVSFTWFLWLTLALPVWGLIEARNGIKKMRLARVEAKKLVVQEKIRIQNDLKPIIQQIDEELDYRTMPCNSCGHKVEQTQ